MNSGRKVWIFFKGRTVFVCFPFVAPSAYTEGIDYSPVPFGDCEGVKKLKFYEKWPFARQDGSLGETLERHLLRLNPRASNDNYSKRLLPKKVALIMMLRNSKVTERDSPWKGEQNTRPIFSHILCSNGATRGRLHFIQEVRSKDSWSKSGGMITVLDDTLR